MIVNLRMQVNIKKSAWCSIRPLVKPCKEAVFAEYAGQQHSMLHDVQIQGETADEPWLGQVS